MTVVCAGVTRPPSLAATELAASRSVHRAMEGHNDIHYIVGESVVNVVAELTRYQTSKSGDDGAFSCKVHVNRIVEGQNDIHYTGESVVFAELMRYQTSAFGSDRAFCFNGRGFHMTEGQDDIFQFIGERVVQNSAELMRCQTSKSGDGGAVSFKEYVSFTVKGQFDFAVCLGL